jgi:hypothetical protein
MAAGAEPSRPPEEGDLVRLCGALNSEGAKYLVVGGMAVLRLGFARATDDVDLLIDGSAENIRRVRQALEVLPDRAVREMGPDDLQNYTVVRVADEIIVDLMISACGISFKEAEPDIEWAEIDGVEIPFASASLLLRMKQTGRERDKLDVLFLEEKLQQSKKRRSE